MPRLGFSSRNQFFSLISSDPWITRRVERNSTSFLPLFIGKWGRCFPPSSPRRARWLPPEATAFWRNLLEGPSGPGCYLHPISAKYTPLPFFLVILFCKVMETYEFRNDTCFLSVMLRNLADYIIIPFLTYRMLQNLTNCVTMLPFEFWHVTELHKLPDDGCQVPQNG